MDLQRWWTGLLCFVPDQEQLERSIIVWTAIPHVNKPDCSSCVVVLDDYLPEILSMVRFTHPQVDLLGTTARPDRLDIAVLIGNPPHLIDGQVWTAQKRSDHRALQDQLHSQDVEPAAQADLVAILVWRVLLIILPG